MPTFRQFLVGALAAITVVLYRPVNQRITTLGLRRPADKLGSIHGHEIKIIPNTFQCEDLHHHLDSGLLFTACGQGPKDRAVRASWFPPLGLVMNPDNAQRGGLFIVDPKTFKSTELKLEGFSGPFVTHGIDVITDPDDKDLLHIFAVNHLPNLEHFLAAGKTNTHEPKAASQIELFTHVLGSGVAKHVRSIKDPLIKTPNDVLAVSPTAFYVTNDHYYREGLGRFAEDALTQYSAPWSDIIFVSISDKSPASPTTGHFAVKALRGLHNNNGLGHGPLSRPDEIIIVDAAGGVLYRGQRNGENPGLKVLESIQFDSTLDNPAWYEDTYKNATHDASGYVVAGLARGIDLARAVHTGDPIPVMVWHLRGEGKVEKDEKHGTWEKRLVFQDDGKTLSSASAAVIVGIDPAENGGKKQGWLFVTGFMSESMVAARIDL